MLILYKETYISFHFQKLNPDQWPTGKKTSVPWAMGYNLPHEPETPDTFPADKLNSDMQQNGPLSFRVLDDFSIPCFS